MARRFLIGAALACAAHAQAQIVELPREVSGIDRKVATSWQVEHPAVTGFVSGIALGLWPSRFGSDVTTKAAVMHVMTRGIGVDAFAYTRDAAFHIFARWRWLGAVVSVAMVVSAVVVVVRRRLQRA